MQLRSCAARIKQRTLLAVLTALVPVGALHAGAVLYVDDDAPPNGNGESWDTAYRFLSDALDAATESDAGVNQIRVAQGLYLPDRSEETPDGSGNRSASFELIDLLELRGGYAGIGAADPDDRDFTLYESVLSGDLLQDNEPKFADLFLADNSYHVVKAIETTPASKLNGLTVTWGYADGQDDVRGGGVFLVDGALNVIDCLFTRNGSRGADTSHARGGAIWSAGSTLNVTRTLFLKNSASHGYSYPDVTPPGGGAIAASASSVSLADCRFEENSVGAYNQSKGGALWAATGTVVVMTRCYFADNRSYSESALTSGGAILLSSAALEATECEFTRNCAYGVSPQESARARGGVLSLWNSSASFEACSFTDNEVTGDGHSFGGVAESADSTLQFSNCLIAGDFVCSDFNDNSGGALYLFDTSATLINTVVAHNWAEASAIYHRGSGMTTILNCALWRNQGGNTIQKSQLDVLHGHRNFHYSCVQGWTGSYGGVGNHGLDPLFADPFGPDGFWWTGHDNDYRLLSGSPCIDAGDNSATDSDTDLGGNDRFVDDPDTVDTGIGTPPIIDMGPYELQLDLCPMDLNDNGAVDFQDLLVLLGAWNNPYSFVDLVELLATWGDCP